MSESLSNEKVYKCQIIIEFENKIIEYITDSNKDLKHIKQNICYPTNSDIRLFHNNKDISSLEEKKLSELFKDQTSIIIQVFSTNVNDENFIIKPNNFINNQEEHNINHHKFKKIEKYSKICSCLTHPAKYFCRKCFELICENCKENVNHKKHLKIILSSENLIENVKSYSSAFELDLTSSLKTVNKIKNEVLLINQDNINNNLIKNENSNNSKLEIYEKLKFQLMQDLNICIEDCKFDLSLNNNNQDFSKIINLIENRLNDSKINLEEIYNWFIYSSNNQCTFENPNFSFCDGVDVENVLNENNNQFKFKKMVKIFKSISKIEKKVSPCLEALEKLKLILEIKKFIFDLDKKIENVLEESIKSINKIGKNYINSIKIQCVEKSIDHSKSKSFIEDSSRKGIFNENIFKEIDDGKIPDKNKTLNLKFINASRKKSINKYAIEKKNNSSNLNYKEKKSKFNYEEEDYKISEMSEKLNNSKEKTGNQLNCIKIGIEVNNEENKINVGSQICEFTDNKKKFEIQRKSLSYNNLLILMKNQFTNDKFFDENKLQKENMINRLSLMLDTDSHIYDQCLKKNKYLELDIFREGLIGRNAIYRTPFGESIAFYSDDTASGRPHRIVEIYIQSILPLYANTHSDSSYFAVTFNALYHQSQNYLTNFFNIPENYSLIPVGNGVTGAVYQFLDILHQKFPNILSNNLNEFKRRVKKIEKNQTSDLPIAIITEYEHHSNILSWEKYGFEVVALKYTANANWNNALIDLNEKLTHYIKRPLIVLSISAASNVTSQISPLNKISEIIKEFKFKNKDIDKKLIWCVDIAAYSSHKKINVTELKMDAIFISPHKLSGGPGSCGLLIFNNNFYSKDDPPTKPGGGTVDGVWGYEHKEVIYSSSISARETAGTPGILQFIRAAACFQLLDRVGFENIEKREHSLTRRFFDEIEKINSNWRREGKNYYIDILGPHDPNLRLSIFSVVLFDETGRKIPYQFSHRLMSDLFGIQLRSGCNCAGPFGVELLKIQEDDINYIANKISEGDFSAKPGWVRFNIHFSYTDEDIDYLIYCFKFVVENSSLILKNLYKRNSDGSYGINTKLNLNDIVMKKKDINDKDYLKVDNNASLHYIYDHLYLDIFNPFQTKEIHESERNSYLKKRVDLSKKIVEFLDKK